MHSATSEGGPRLSPVFRRLRPMTEAECYERCYPRPKRLELIGRRRIRPRLIATMSGEQLRRLFEKRLDSREREAA
jgi:hypothetical protein